MRELFKQNRLKIHVSCQNLITELETYRYPDKKPEHNTQENPIKENDHACDALRYPIMMNCPSPSLGSVPRNQGRFNVSANNLDSEI